MWHSPLLNSNHTQNTLFKENFCNLAYFLINIEFSECNEGDHGMCLVKIRKTNNFTKNLCLRQPILRCTVQTWSKKRQFLVIDYCWTTSEFLVCINNLRRQNFIWQIKFPLRILFSKITNGKRTVTINSLALILTIPN